MKDIEPLRAQGEQFVDAGDIISAQKSFRQIIAIKPDDLKANYMLGVLLAEQGNTDEATGFLEKAIGLDQSYPDSYLVLARICLAKNEYQQAMDYCKKAVELDPDFEDAWQLLCGLSSHLREYATAYISCKKAMSFSPQSFSVQFNFGNSLFVQKKYDEAAKHYKIAVDLDSNPIEAWQALVHSLYNCKKLEDAQKYAVAALKRFPSDLFLHNLLSGIFIDTGFFDQAEQQLKKALALGNGNADLFIVLGNLHQRKHEHDKAIEVYQKALTLSPNTAQIYFNIGCSYLELENYQYAQEYLRKTVELNQGIPEAKHLLAVAEGKNPEDRADNEHLTYLFDDYAERYDESQKMLQYSVPRLISNTIKSTIVRFGNSNKLDILDLGCGTGLCAPYIQDICNSLTGVDLSPEMTRAAEKLNIYNELIVGDMNEFMSSKYSYFDIIFAADVFVYIGKLTTEFESAWAALKDNGFFIFSVQVNDDVDDFELTKRGRYNHARAYISSLTKQYGFVEISHEEIISRVELGVPVNSRIHVLQKKLGSIG